MCSFVIGSWPQPSRQDRDAGNVRWQVCRTYDDGARVRRGTAVVRLENLGQKVPGPRLLRGAEDALRFAFLHDQAVRHEDDAV